MLSEYSFSSTEYLQQLLTSHGLDLEIIQTSKGVYSNHIISLFLPTLRINKSSHSNETTSILHGTLIENEFLITIPLDQGYTRINGVEILSKGSNIVCPKEIVHMTTSVDSSKNTVNVGIPEASLEHYLGQEIVTYIINNATSIRSQLYQSQEFYHAQKEMAVYIDHILSHPINYNLQALLDIEDTLYAYIVSLMTECINGEYIQNPPFNKRLAIVKRAIEYIDSSTLLHISIPTILQHTFCSVRSLEYAFNNILGISPKRYLILRRMHLIRKQLLRNPKYKIKDIVSQYGIVNLGRFAHDFNTLFGEYPKGLMLKQLSSNI